jgi:nuclear cap-binding protein subunit 1
VNAVRWAEGSITQLPVKTPVYGTLVGLINAKNADFGREVVSKAGERLQQALHDRNVLDVKLLTRFLAELVNAHVLPAADLVALFDLLLASAAELDDSLQHSDLEHYAYVVLITIPFVAATLLRDLPDELDRLLRTLQRYVDAHKCPINPLTLVYPDPEVPHLLPCDRDPRSLGAREIVTAAGLFFLFSFSFFFVGPVWAEQAQDYFESYLWKQLAELKEDGWRSGAILQPYISFEDHLSTAPRHTLPTIALPPSSVRSPSSPVLSAHFRWAMFPLSFLIDQLAAAGGGGCRPKRATAH